MPGQDLTLFTIYKQYKQDPTESMKDALLKKVRACKAESGKKRGQRHFYNQEGETLLCKVIIDGNNPLARILIEDYQFGINEPSRQGLYPIHHAVQKKAVTTVHILLLSGANINVQEKQQLNTALHLCLKQPVVDVALVNLLADKCSDYEIANLYGETPIDLAEKYDKTNPSQKIASILLKAHSGIPPITSSGSVRKTLTRLEEVTKDLDRRVSQNERDVADLRSFTDTKFATAASNLEATTQKLDQLSNLVLTQKRTQGPQPSSPVEQEMYGCYENDYCDLPESQDDKLLDPRTQEKLQQSLDEFVKNVKMDRVLTALCSNRVITMRELEEARAMQSTGSDVAEKIFMNLMRGTYGTLKKAKEVLVQDGQVMVASLIPDV